MSLKRLEFREGAWSEGACHWGHDLEGVPPFSLYFLVAMDRALSSPWSLLFISAGEPIAHGVKP